MNSISLEELKKVTPVLATQNVSDDYVFDYMRIIDLNNVKYENDATSPLYFLIYNTEKEIEQGWFNIRFDLREHANEIISKYPNCTFVIEEGMESSIEDKSAKYIVVKNMHDTVDDLFEYRKQNSLAKTVAVTGSVGKTTLTGLIESVLSKKYNVLRIYSKRITPIVLKANIINFLSEDTDYVVLENAIYYHDHVKVLSDLLNPDIACMLNIKSSHLNVEKLNTLDDICIYKSHILKHAKVGLINASDEYLKGIDLKDGLIEYNSNPLFDTNLEQLVKLSMDHTKIDGNKVIIDNKIKVEPFILSDLSRIQYTFGYSIGKMLGIEEKQIEDAMKDYHPVENRLNIETAFGKEIVLDGEITTYERMRELSNLSYDKQYLILRKVGSAENTDRISNITDFFDKFNRVYIFDDIEYLDELKDHPNVSIVSNHDFMNGLFGKIIYHYSGYFRTYDTFNENNLKIYDKEKYTILKK